MRLARITGRVSASAKLGNLLGVTTLVADFVDAGGEVLERAVVVADACRAGPGDLVLVTTGAAARMGERTSGVPTDATVVAIVDQLSIGDRDVDLTPPEPD